ncbi:hypothetical protein [Acuticoccus mangrovi]|uniref:Uncharacterized protein n=1 Tax=Acuticoccus mangrovi TaxID=2796142 RepID=A0A934IT53_9HYPH|nr:hypothetical protein [Acuticoccus mangrovi]MBJ3778326.1 hypothetical protein [Acuticoccus mangrovi]
MALLRNAAFPELARANGLNHEFVIVDPSTTRNTPTHEDMVTRVCDCARRLNIPTVVIGNQAHGPFSQGGFTSSIYELAEMDRDTFAATFATLRERLGWVLASSRFSRNRHILIPAFDASILAIVVELLAQMPAASRPFVHLATWWDEAQMPNVTQFGPLDRFGRAIHHLNSDRPTTFLYAWSRRLAQRLTAQLGLPVQPLDTPPELSLSEEAEQSPDRFTVGYLSSTTAGGGFDRLPSIVRSTNRAATNPRRTRFVVQIKPPASGEAPSSVALSTRAALAAIPERNVSLIEEFVPRPVYFSAIRQLDAVLLPYRPDDSERFSATAHHAMAAGKLIFTYDGVHLPGTIQTRVLTAPDDRTLGELIADVSADLAAVRTAASVARSTYWATLRPSRIFAQLLYGPVVIGNAVGAEAI